MKKRIISLILTVVMLSLSLVGCGYSFIDDDLSQYATFDKAKFEEAIKALSIEDGDFTTDPEARATKVLDKIYQTLSQLSKETKTEGVIGAHDVFYYCYYMTCENADGKVVQLAPDNIKTDKALKLQLGISTDKNLEKAILEAVKDFDFTDKAYKSETGVVAKDGQAAFISYKWSYDVVTEEKDKDGNPVLDDKGNPKTKTTNYHGEVTLQKVILDKEDALHKNLLFKTEKTTVKNDTTGKDEEKTVTTDIKVGTTASDFVIKGGYDIKGDGVIKQDITISKGKIEFIADGEAFAPIVDATFTEEKELKDIYGNNLKLKDKDITYYVYPVKYGVVDELKTTNIINLIYSGKFTADVLGNILFGADFSTKTDDEKKTASKDFSVNDGDKKLDFADFSESLLTAIEKYDDAKSTLSDAESDLDKAKDTLTKAETEANKEGLSEDEKTTADQAVKDAKTAVDKAQTAVNTAKTAFDDAEKARDTKIAMLITGDKKLAEAYVDVVNKANAAEDKLNTAKSESETANEKLKAAETARDKAKETAEKKGATDADKKAYDEAKKAFDTAKTEAEKAANAYNTAKTEYEKAVKARDTELAKTKESDLAFVEGYKNVVYSELQEAYRTTIEQNIAKEVYKQIETYVTVNSVPKEVSEKLFDQLYENYEFAFYADVRLESDTSTSTSAPGFYKTYNGSFKEFVIKYAVPTDLGKKVDNYEQAIAAMQTAAEDAVKPIVRMYVVAKAYDLVYSEEDFDNYKHENEDDYTYGEYYNGEDAVRYTLQFNKLMNFFIESEEKVDEEDARYKSDVYKNVTVAELTEADD